VAVYEELTAPSASELKTSDFQSMSRRVKKAADRLEGVNPTLASQLLQASESLKAEDITAAKETLSSVATAISDLTGSVGDFADTLQARDYQGAAAALRDLSDPAKTPLDTARLAIIPDQFKKIRKTLKDASPEMSEEVKQAYESLEAGNTEAARGSFARAADFLDETAQAIARSDAASQARVVRTFWGIDTQNHAVNWEKGHRRDRLEVLHRRPGGVHSATKRVAAR
jgi:uncharacterized protein YoxC